MATLTDTLNFTASFVQGTPLYAWPGYNPAVTIANINRNTIMNAPFAWPWNRAEDTSTATVAGTQNYTIALANFGWLEKVTLIPGGSGKNVELKDILNLKPIGIGDANSNQRPNEASVQLVSYGTNVTLRFVGVPDAAYTIGITYQMLPVPFKSFKTTSVANVSAGNTVYTGVYRTASFIAGQTALVTGFVTAANNGEFTIVSVTGTTLTLANPGGVAETPATAAQIVNESWEPVPDAFVDIYNNLFLGEAFQDVDDARGAQYRQRGIVALLSKSEGLDSMQKSVYLEQFLARDVQALQTQLRTQQASQARGV